MKKIITSLCVLVLGLCLVVPALAEESAKTTSTPIVKAYKAREVVVSGVLTSISNKDLTIKLTKITPATVKNYPGTYPAKDSSIVVKVVDKTKIVRKYSGKADFSELAVNDSLWVNGRLEADGTITAQLVKDNSIAKNFLYDKGEVMAIDTAANTFSIKKGNETYKVFVTVNTKFYKANKTLSGLAELSVGDWVSVKGVARQSAGEITADSIRITKDKSDEEARLQKIKEQEKTRLQTMKEKLEKQLEEIKAKLEKLL